MLPACSSLFPLLPSPSLLCWAVSRRLDGMPGRVQAGRLLGDRRRLSGWGGAGRLQAAGVGAGVFFASASLPLSVSLRASSAAGLVSVPLGVLLSVPMLGRGCPLWLCLCWGTVASWARLSGVMLGGRSGRRAHGKMHKYKAVSLAIFHPLKYFNDEQNH